MPTFYASFCFSHFMSFSRKKRSDTPPTPDEALRKLEHFCAYRERSPQEVRQKIKEMGLDRETAEQIYQVLADDKFFDEARFAQAYAYGKFRQNHWGKVRIRQELNARGIAPAVVYSALENIEEAEYMTVLRKLAAQKKGQVADDPQAFAKTVAYLARTGFEMDRIMVVCKAIYRDVPEDWEG